MHRSSSLAKSYQSGHQFHLKLLSFASKYKHTCTNTHMGKHRPSCRSDRMQPKQTHSKGIHKNCWRMEMFALISDIRMAFVETEKKLEGNFSAQFVCLQMNLSSMCLIIKHQIRCCIGILQLSSSCTFFRIKVIEEECEKKVYCQC